MSSSERCGHVAKFTPLMALIYVNFGWEAGTCVKISNDLLCGRQLIDV